MSMQAFAQMLKTSNEAGSTNKAPIFTANTNYVEWRQKFEAFISYNEPDMMIPLLERYEHPRQEGVFEGIAPPKSIRALNADEKKSWDMERKVHSALVMSLSSDVLKMFKHHDIAYDMWQALERRCGGSDKYKKSRLELVKRQYELFDMLENESLNGLFIRYSHLVSELSDGGVKMQVEDINKKLLSALPKKWNHRVMMMEEDEGVMSMSLDDFIGRLQAYALDMQRKETKSSAHIQDPSIYGSKSSSSGIALLSGGGLSSATKTSTASGGASSGSYIFSGGSLSSSGGSKANQASPATEENAAVFQAFLSAYDSFLSQKTSSIDLTDEDFDQINPDDLERMDIRWNFAMLTRRTKRYLRKTGKKNLDDDSDSGLGFDKSKVKCYKCHNLGHFARECEKSKQPASGLSKPSASKKSTAKDADKLEESINEALLLTNDEYHNWSDTDENIHNTALMAEISDEVQIDEPLSCVNCIKLTGKINRYSEDNARLYSDLDKLKQANQLLKENEKIFDKKINATMTERKDLKAKIYCQQDAIDSYLKKIVELQKALDESKTEVIDLKRKVSNFSTSSVVFDEILQAQRINTKSKSGIGYQAVPPPANYEPMPSKDDIKNFVPSTVKEGKSSVKEPVILVPSEKGDKPISQKKAKALPVLPTIEEEVIEIEDVTDEIDTQVIKLDVKPENFIITNEPCSEIPSLKVKSKAIPKVKKEQNFANNKSISSKPITNNYKSKSTSFSRANSPCTFQCACSVNRNIKSSSVVQPQFQSVVERRSCFYCKKQGHLISVCPLLSRQRFGRTVPRSSVYRNFSKSSPKHSSMSPKPVKKTDKIMSVTPTCNQQTLVKKQPSKPLQVWKVKESKEDSSSHNTPSIKVPEILKNHVLIDVVIMDDSGRPKSIKAWVSHSN